MMVKELIEQLESYDENMQVLVHHNGVYNFDTKEGSRIGVPCVWLKVIPSKE